MLLSQLARVVDIVACPNRRACEFGHVRRNSLRFLPGDDDARIGSRVSRLGQTDLFSSSRTGCFQAGIGMNRECCVPSRLVLDCGVQPDE